jgi:hypothetical protein
MIDGPYRRITRVLNLCLCCCIKISLQLVTDDLRSYGAAVGAESGRKASLPALTFSVKSR